MANRRTWIWIVVGCLALCGLALFAVAGAGLYFVTSRIDTERSTLADATKAFDDVRARFKEQSPLFDLDRDERPRVLRDPADLPTSNVPTKDLMIMVWDADESRIVRLALPFWLLRMGGQNVDLNDGHSFDLSRLNLNVADLERIGPVVVLDLRTPSGERVLLWTQ